MCAILFSLLGEEHLSPRLQVLSLHHYHHHHLGSKNGIIPSSLSSLAFACGFGVGEAETEMALDSLMRSVIKPIVVAPAEADAFLFHIPFLGLGSERC